MTKRPENDPLRSQISLVQEHLKAVQQNLSELANRLVYDEHDIAQEAAAKCAFMVLQLRKITRDFENGI
jgi:hypothetical protein